MFPEAIGWFGGNLSARTGFSPEGGLFVTDALEATKTMKSTVTVTVVGCILGLEKYPGWA